MEGGGGMCILVLYQVHQRWYPCSKEARAPLLIVQSRALANESSCVRFCPEQRAETARWRTRRESEWVIGPKNSGEGGRWRGGEFSAFLAHLDTTEFMTRVVRNLRVSGFETKYIKHNLSVLLYYEKYMSGLSGFDVPWSESSFEFYCIFIPTCSPTQTGVTRNSFRNYF